LFLPDKWEASERKWVALVEPASPKNQIELRKRSWESGRVRERNALERPAQPEEVAPAFVFFGSPAGSSCITGEVLTLLGGETTAA
jgi:NAD(P)-dependent dehydrogenase (short-subunit alcohol dehydrogenase family)